jgi:lysophospholipase L1-like esterase
MMRKSFVITTLLVVATVVVLLFTVNNNRESSRIDTSQRIKIGFIGDSITVGASDSHNPVRSEMNLLGDSYTSLNRAVNGTVTADWLPGKQRYDNTVSVFKSKGVDIVSIMLGTNDANRGNVTPEKYYENMYAIVSDLLIEGDVAFVIINYPPYTDKSDKLPQFAKQLDKLVNGVTIIKGDTAAYDYFKRHQNLLTDGVHPTDKGYEELGSFWAKSLKDFLATRLERA